MKYVLTGSTGHISRPAAQQLIKAGHEVTIITHSADRVKDIEGLGANAAVGSVEDKAFLKNTFTGADAVYLMIPPKFDVKEWLTYQKSVADNYVEAVKSAGVKYVVVLSSIGAHRRTGVGPVDGIAYLEEKLDAQPEINATYLRPSYFYYNLFSMVGMIKHAGIMGSNQPADFKMVLVHTDDIAEAAVEALQDSVKGKKVRYISSDERSWKEITEVLTKAVGKEGTPWVEFTDEQSKAGMLQAGLSETIANGYVQMGIALRENKMQEDYFNHRPAKSGKVKLEDFAKEFVAVYNS